MTRRGCNRRTIINELFVYRDNFKKEFIHYMIRKHEYARRLT